MQLSSKVIFTDRQRRSGKTQSAAVRGLLDIAVFSCRPLVQVFCGA
jgi:hypothetical protein